MFVVINQTSAIGGAPAIVFRAKSLVDLCAIVREFDDHMGTEYMHMEISSMATHAEVPAEAWEDLDTQVIVREEDGCLYWLYEDGMLIDI